MDELLIMVVLVDCLAEVGMREYRKTKNKRSLFFIFVTMIIIPFSINVFGNLQNIGVEMIFSLLLSFSVLGFFMGLPLFLASRKV